MRLTHASRMLNRHGERVSIKQESALEFEIIKITLRKLKISNKKKG